MTCPPGLFSVSSCSVKPSGHASPSAPAGPGGPGGPCGPGAPGVPLRPAAPAGPGWPTSPGGPMTPGAPTGPGAPARPSVPRSPFGPGGPDGPRGPVSPGGPWIVTVVGGWFATAASAAKPTVARPSAPDARKQRAGASIVIGHRRWLGCDEARICTVCTNGEYILTPTDGVVVACVERVFQRADGVLRVDTFLAAYLADDQHHSCGGCQDSTDASYPGGELAVHSRHYVTDFQKSASVHTWRLSP